MVVAGDHGESLGDHGERDHGIFVYQSVLRVPLIVRAPNVAPRRIRSVVRLVDVLPTVLELLDFRWPRGDGVSLLAMMQGRQPPSISRPIPSRCTRGGSDGARSGRSATAASSSSTPRDANCTTSRPIRSRSGTCTQSDVPWPTPSPGDCTRSVAPTRSTSRRERNPPEPLRQRLAALGYVGTTETQPPDQLAPSRGPQGLHRSGRRVVRSWQFRRAPVVGLPMTTTAGH